VPLFARVDDPEGVVAVAPLQQSGTGGSGSFLVVADDGRRYWCKTINNTQNEPRLPTNEQVVARLGLLIAAPVCEPQLVRIPSDLAAWEFRPGRALEAGWAHGSLAAEPVIETRDMANRSTDDNARRHAGLYALHDWLAGSDGQWLMVGADAAYVSHDHGHFFPGGPGWTPTVLQQNVASPYPLGFPVAGVDAGELRRLADALEGVAEQEVAEVMSKIPRGWPVTDDELEALMTFVLDRRAPAAQRLRDLAAGV